MGMAPEATWARLWGREGEHVFSLSLEGFYWDNGKEAGNHCNGVIYGVGCVCLDLEARKIGGPKPLNITPEAIILSTLGVLVGVMWVPLSMIGAEQGERHITVQTPIQRSGTSPRIPFQSLPFPTNEAISQH